MKKKVFLLLFIALLSVPMGFAATQKVHAAGGGSVQVVYSSYNNTDTNNRLNAQPNKSLTPIDNTTANAVITVDPSITYQPWLGFGGSIEHDSIWELNRLSAADKASALDALFNPATASDTLDGSLSTRWANGSSQANGQWFQFDMGKINSISGVTLNAASFTGDYPCGYAVDLSIDGTNWQRVASGSVPAQDVMISIPVNFARYIKVTQTGSAANWWSIAEVNVLGVESAPASGTKISHTGWTASASHTETGGNPGVAIDEWLQAARNAPYSDPLNHTASRWTSGKSQSGNEWFQVDMGSARTFNTLEINSGGSASDYARSFTLYVSNDGANWTPIASSDGTGPVQRVKFATVNARYFNINQTGTAGQWWSIAEINLYQQ